MARLYSMLAITVRLVCRVFSTDTFTRFSLYVRARRSLFCYFVFRVNCIQFVLFNSRYIIIVVFIY